MVYSKLLKGIFCPNLLDFKIDYLERKPSKRKPRSFKKATMGIQAINYMFCSNCNVVKQGNQKSSAYSLQNHLLIIICTCCWYKRNNTAKPQEATHSAFIIYTSILHFWTIPIHCYFKIDKSIAFVINSIYP